MSIAKKHDKSATMSGQRKYPEPLLAPQKTNRNPRVRAVIDFMNLKPGRTDFFGGFGKRS